jgi:hypothetical protein
MTSELGTRSAERQAQDPEPSSAPRSECRVPGSAWMRFWFTPADPINLGVMRIATGLIALYVVFSYSFDLLSWVSAAEGWTDAPMLHLLRRQWPITVWTNDWSGNVVTVDRGQYTWSIFFHLHDPAWIWSAHLAHLLVLVLFTLGLWTRITSVLAWLAYQAYFQRCQHCVFGMDSMIVIATTYLALAPCGAALSLDRLLEQLRARRERQDPGYRLPPSPPLVSAGFVLRLFQVHFCYIYLASGLSKLLGPAWWSGSALWGTVANYSFAPLSSPLYLDGLRWLTRHRWLFEVLMAGGTAYTLIVEISFPFLVWLPRWRWLLVIGSILLHLGIGILMGLVTFSLMMMTLVFSFIPPEAVRQAIAQLSGLRAQPTPQTGSVLPAESPKPVLRGQQA